MNDTVDSQRFVATLWKNSFQLIEISDSKKKIKQINQRKIIFDFINSFDS